MYIRVTTQADDLSAICAQITPEKWGKDNEMTRYDETALREFLKDDKNILILAWDGDNISGAALAYELPHPSSGESSIYVHELDTHPNYRRQGVATRLMKAVFNEAKKRGLSEVWIAADHDNETANTFYKSLKPTEIDPSVTYSYKVS